jgi:hypothetical protein
MDMAALDARDQSAPGFKPRITTDVRRRHHQAGCILIANALTELVPGKIYAVRAGAAPACILRLDLENERELKEGQVDSRTDELLKPLHDHMCKPTLAVLSAAGKQRPTYPHYLVDFTRTPPFCSCPDYTKRGGAHDLCKHGKAATLKRVRGEAAGTRNKFSFE